MKVIAQRRSDSIVAWANIILVVIGGLALIGGFWKYTEDKFATKESLNSEKIERIDGQKEISDKLDLIIKFMPRRGRSDE